MSINIPSRLKNRTFFHTSLSFCIAATLGIETDFCLEVFADTASFLLDVDGWEIFLAILCEDNRNAEAEKIFAPQPNKKSND